MSAAALSFSHKPFLIGRSSAGGIRGGLNSKPCLVCNAREAHWLQPLEGRKSDLNGTELMLEHLSRNAALIADRAHKGRTFQDALALGGHQQHHCMHPPCPVSTQYFPPAFLKAVSVRPSHEILSQAFAIIHIAPHIEEGNLRS